MAGHVDLFDGHEQAQAVIFVDDDVADAQLGFGHACGRAPIRLQSGTKQVGRGHHRYIGLRVDKPFVENEFSLEKRAPRGRKDLRQVGGFLGPST
ncbi:hypothetical protein X740_27885 [Mesorhizobium sp. LNHC221B00]|nr:hypothetical protein X740_27885 [Mesorhizobium sp. LNHC221B00]